MKVCPRCGRTWPDTGRFCPMDGTALVQEAPPPPPPAESSEPSPSRAGETPSAPPESVPEARTQTRRGTRGTRAVRATPSERPAPPSPANGSEGEVPRKGRSKGAFSETKWFMVGELEVPKDEIGPEILAPKDLEPRYRKTRELPPEVRRRFSLEREEDGTKGSK